MKQKLKISLALGGIALLLIGCTEPEFNPSNKGLVFYGGKPYAIPDEGNYKHVNKLDIEIYKRTSRKESDFYEYAKKSGLDELTFSSARNGANIALQQCKVGDLVWVNPSIVDSNKNDKLKRMFLAIGAFQTGQAGCASPLSQQEYQYYLAKGSDTTQGSMDSINNSLQNTRNSIQQNTYNTQQATNQVQQLNNQMYQQKQDKKTNYQLQQINNNLNGIRNGY